MNADLSRTKHTIRTLEGQYHYLASLLQQYKSEIETLEREHDATVKDFQSYTKRIAKAVQLLQLDLDKLK
jgi:hypothetical protein